MTLKRRRHFESDRKEQTAKKANRHEVHSTALDTTHCHQYLSQFIIFITTKKAKENFLLPLVNISPCKVILRNRPRHRPRIRPLRLLLQGR